MNVEQGMMNFEGKCKNNFIIRNSLFDKAEFSSVFDILFWFRLVRVRAVCGSENVLKNMTILWYIT